MIDLTLFFLCLAGSILFLTLVFFAALWQKRYDIIDIAWGLAFIAIATISFISNDSGTAMSVQVIVTSLVILWGLRLSLHINARWIKTRSEDKRYSDLKRKYKASFGGLKVNMYVRIFLAQAVLAVLVSLPVIVINSSETMSPTLLTIAGVIVWLVGFYFEAVGDFQLKRHLSNPENKGILMTSGLWRYTRHPNYFGEITQWWGIFIIALSFPFWWISIIGPAVITILILFVSGVSLTEKHFEGRSGWDTYKKHTSKLIPLPRRR